MEDVGAAVRVPVVAIVVNHRSGPLLGSALDRLALQDGVGRTVVVDNASDDGSADAAEDRPGVTLLRSAENVGFAAGVQLGLAASTEPYVLLLNADAELDAGYVAALAAALDADPGLAGATGLLLLPEGRVDTTGIELTRAAWAADRDRGAPAEAARAADEPFGVSGAACLLRRAALDEVGGPWTELFVYWEDVELAWRLGRAGWRFAFVPTATGVHQRGADGADPTFVEAASLRGRLATLARHRGLRGLLDPGPALVTAVVLARLAVRHPAALRAAHPLGAVRAGLAARRVDRGAGWAALPDRLVASHPWSAWSRAQLGGGGTRRAGW